MNFVLRFLGTAAAVYLTVSLVPGVMIQDLPATQGLAQPGAWMTVMLVALVWSAVMTVIKPVLTILTLPITIVTFGLFALIINALLFMLVAAIVPGFAIAGFFPAIVGALVLSLLTWLIHQVF